MKLVARLIVPVALLAGGLAPAAVAHASANSATAGTRLWEQAFTGGSSRNGLGTAMAVSPDRAVVYVTGFTAKEPGELDSDDTTLAYNSTTGAVLWEARYQGVYHPQYRPAIVISPNGATLFVASDVHTSRGYNYLIEAYNARTGALRWTAEPTGIESSVPAQHPLAVSPDSSAVFITGDTIVGHPRSYTTVAFSTATGEQSWTAITPFLAPFQPSNIAVSPDGSAVFVIGEAGTVAYDAHSGATLWQADHKQGAVGLAVSPDSSAVYVTAVDGSQKDYWLTTAYSTASGAQLWAVRFTRRGDQDQAGSPESLVVSPDGSQVIVGGTAFPGTARSHFQLFSYDATTGAQLWAATYSASSGGPIGAEAMAITPNGAEVALTGTLGGSADYKYVTAGFNATTGAQLWSAQLAGPAGSSSAPVSVGASPDSARVFVTGGSINDSIGSREYLTAAYHS
ncbi:MAG TPA: PQQ-binding-like beta-propeller repeat protein [Streptosporangiaceae bacterium]|jgi:WD40 repeat protein